MSFAPRFIVIALWVLWSNSVVLAGELRFEAFRMQWPEGYTRRTDVGTPQQPVFSNDSANESMSVTVYRVPSSWSEAQVRVQRERWLVEGSRKLLTGRPKFKLVSPPHQELLSSGSFLVSAIFEGSTENGALFIQQFLLVAPTANAVFFVISGVGEPSAQYGRFRPYFETAVWE